MDTLFLVVNLMKGIWRNNSILLQAACKFLKKEAQKVTGESSELGKRLKKDLKQEIFGLKHGLHSAPRLKKVERKRLADLVINLRNHA